MKLHRLKFRTRIILAYAGFVILSILAFSLFFLRAEESRLRRSQEQELATQARQLAVITSRASSSPRPVWTAEIRTMAGIAGVRLTLIAADGKVIGDSQHDAETMDNHAGRPEIRQALAGATGLSYRFSRTIGTDLLYVAVPVVRDGRITGAVRVARPQSEIEAGLRKLRFTFIGGALVSSLLAMIFGIAVISAMTKPLQALAVAAGRLGGGEFATRVRDFGQDELGLVARAFNRMAGQLERLVANLGEEKGKLLTILATMADGVIVFDLRQRVTLANRAAGEFLGLVPEEMLGKTPVELLLPPPAVDLIDKAVKDNIRAEGECEVHWPVSRALSIVLMPIRDSERGFHGMLAVLRDLTSLRRLERVRQDFVANVSHELRTPLASIKLMAETMLQGEVGAAERRKFLGSIDAECDRLNALVADLLTLARLDSGSAQPRLAVFSLADLIRETAAGLFSAGSVRHPVLDLPADLPPVKADPDQIRQILINLLDNAVKYSPPSAPFGVGAAANGAWVTVVVWDRGPGIPEEDRERIFERFYRIDKARSRAIGGTGLGLSIVKHLVEAYGGRVWAENNQGARFHFTVPKA